MGKQIRRTTFTDLEKMSIAAAWILAAGASYLFLPVGIALWFAVGATFKIWPKPGLGNADEIQVYNMMSEGQRRQADVIKAIGKGMFGFSGGVLGFGDPGDPGGVGGEGERPSGWPPARLSSWWALIIATAATIAVLVAPLPFPIKANSPLLQGIGTFIGIYIMVQAFNNGWRDTRDDIDTAPAVAADAELTDIILHENRGALIVSAIFGLGVIGFIPIALAQPIWLTVIAAITGASLGAFATYTKISIGIRAGEWRDYIERRDTWTRRWESIPKLSMPPPIYGDSVGSPTSAPTHELVSFACPEGVTWLEYSRHLESLMSQVGKSILTIAPMPMRDENNQNIPGSENPAEFYLAYPMAGIEPTAHLSPKTDANTRKFLVMWHVQDAIRAAKLDHLTLLSLRPLCLPDSPSQLFESKWRLPRTISYQKIAETTTLLTRALRVPWLRIGTTELSVDGRPLPTDEIVIVFGDPPQHAQLADRSGTVRHQLDSLAWDGWWRACKVNTREGVTPRLVKSEINKRGILEAYFALPEGISFEHTEMAISSLTSATGYAYIEIEPDDQPSRIYLTAGEKDPLNELYLFADWEEAVVKYATPGEPLLEWCAGIGVDGEPLWYRFESELPHLHIAGASGSGKELALNVPIPLASGGFTTMGDIKAGDRIFDENGNPCNVTYIYDVKIPEKCYELTFDDGTKIKASGEHKWRTHDFAYRQAIQRLRKRTDEDGVLHGRQDVVDAAHRVRGLADRCREIVPHVSPHVVPAGLNDDAAALGVSGERVAASVPAFVLGAWVGSGMRSDGRLGSRGDLASVVEGLGWACSPIGGSAKSVMSYWTVLRLKGVLEAGGLNDVESVKSLVSGFDASRLGEFLAGVSAACGEREHNDEIVSVMLVQRSAEVVEVALTAGGVEFAEKALKRKRPAGKNARRAFEFDASLLVAPKVEHWAEFSPPPFSTGFWLASGGPQECLVTVGEQETLDAFIREGFIPSRLSEERVNPRWVIRGLKRELDRFGMLDGESVSGGALDDRWLNVSLNDRKAFIAGVSAGRVDSSGVVEAVFGDVETAKVVSLVAQDVLGSAVDVEQVGSGWRVSFTAARLEGSSTDNKWLLDYAPMEQISKDAGGYLPLLWKLAARNGIAPIPARRAAEQRYSNRVVTKSIRTFLYPRAVMLDLLADHLYDLALGSSEKAPAVVNTDEIFNSLHASNRGTNHAIPLAGAVEYDEDPDLLVPPYVLGAWLGDGSSATGYICGIDHEVFDRVSQWYEITQMKYGSSSTRAVHSDFRLMKPEGLRAHLKELNLINNKHIPEQYMRASVEDRLALLQGLIDTDGSVTKTGNTEFYASDEALARQVHTLVASLGLKPSLRVKELPDPNHKDAYTVSFTTSQFVTSLSRKAERLPVGEDVRETNRYRYIVSCEPIEPVPMRCIEVDSASHEYLCSESFIPTHNSALTNSMIVQLCYANTPDDLAIRMIEPKNELHAFAGLAHVTHFVDMFTPADSIFQAAADMLEDTAMEMERRYSLFNKHPLGPQKLSEARQIARKEGAMPDGSKHPLDMPYILVIVEECSDIYRKPVLKQQIPEWERVIYNSEWLARKARAAGIFLVTITQRPTRDSIPITVKDQSRRIGLSVETNMQSMIIIDRPGLEDIPAQSKGRGLMSYGKGYRGFRSLYMRRPDESSPNEPDDRARLLAALPQRATKLGMGAPVTGSGSGPLNTVGGEQRRAAPPVPDGIWD
jgi:hypothetical protein